jgi:hypothetical protein
MGDIVSREELPSAVSLNSMGFNLMRCIGPAAGGVIVAAAGGGGRLCRKCAQLRCHHPRLIQMGVARPRHSSAEGTYG